MFFFCPDAKKLLSSTAGDTPGIGIANTNHRLIQLFGEGLHIDSEPETGTTVSFRIPKNRPTM